MMKFPAFGIFTFGSVWAFISSFSPISLLSEEHIGGERVDLVVGERARRRSTASRGG